MICTDNWYNRFRISYKIVKKFPGSGYGIILDPTVCPEYDFWLSGGEFKII